MYSDRELNRLHNKILAHHPVGQVLRTARAATLFNITDTSAASYVLRLMARRGLVRIEGTGPRTRYFPLEAQHE